MMCASAIQILKEIYCVSFKWNAEANKNTKYSSMLSHFAAVLSLFLFFFVFV